MLPGGLQWLVSDTDRARHEADERLNLRAGEDAGWQERGLVDRVLARFRIPLTVFEIGPEGRVPHGRG